MAEPAKCYYPCTIQPPCNNCDCVEFICCEQKSSQQSCCAPSSGAEKCPESCCTPPASNIKRVEKPKKSLWQQLFGEKKCCNNICSKNKVGKKQKFKPLPECSSHPRNSCKPACKPMCVPIAKPCKPLFHRPCLPTPNSVCGCQFYFNIENRPRKVFTENIQRTEYATNTNRPNINNYNTLYMDEEPVRDVDLSYPKNIESHSPNRDSHSENRYSTFENRYSNSENRYSNSGNRYSSSGTRHSNYLDSKPYFENMNPSSENRKKSSSPERKRISYSPCESRKCSSPCPVSRKTCKSIKCCPVRKTEEKCSKDDIQIDLTITKEETKYFSKNENESPKIVVEDNSLSKGRSILVGRDSDESTDRIVTFEIHNSGIKLNGIEEKSGSVLSGGEGHEHTGNDQNDITHPLVDEYDYIHQLGLPTSESFSREIAPLLKKKRSTMSLKRAETKHVGDDRLNKNLERRVSEILRKLHSIEEKINSIELKEEKSNDIRIDFDAQKSTVSVHFKDTRGDCSNETNHTRNSHNKCHTAAFQIRQTRSKSSSPRRNPSCSQVNELQTSQSLDRMSTTQKSAKRIIIKIPKTSNNQNISTPNSYYDSSKQHNVKKNTITWCEVSNDLKQSKQKYTPTCYCYDCTHKRNSCKY